MISRSSKATFEPMTNSVNESRRSFASGTLLFLKKGMSPKGGHEKLRNGMGTEHVLNISQL